MPQTTRILRSSGKALKRAKVLGDILRKAEKEYEADGTCHGGETK